MGPSDRAGGKFKRTIRSAVKAGHVLLTADEIEKYCEEHFNHQITCQNHDVQNTEHDVNGEHDGDGHRVSEHDVPRKRDGHSLFKVYNHKVIRKPKNVKDLNTLEGTRDHVHVVRNTGIKGLIEYRNFDCCCLSCTTHSGECTQKDYADNWKTFWLLPVEQTDEKPSDWFKPVCVQTRNENNDLMEFEEDIDLDMVNCDEIEEENEDNRDEVDDDVSDGKQGEGDECDVQNANEAQSDVTMVKVGDKHDVHNSNEAQSDVTIVEVGDECDIQNEAQRMIQLLKSLLRNMKVLSMSLITTTLNCIHQKFQLFLVRKMKI